MDGLFVHDAPLQVQLFRQIVHHVQKDLFQDGPETPGAGAAL